MPFFIHARQWLFYVFVADVWQNTSIVMVIVQFWILATEDASWKISHRLLDVIATGARMACLPPFCRWFITHYSATRAILPVTSLSMAMCCTRKVIWCASNSVSCIARNSISCDLKNCSIISRPTVTEDWICVVSSVRSVVIFIRSDRWEELAKTCYSSAFGTFSW